MAEKLRKGCSEGFAYARCVNTACKEKRLAKQQTSKVLLTKSHEYSPL